MKFLTTILLILSFYGCQSGKNNNQPEKYNSDRIKNLITQAIDEDSTANIKLSNLVDLNANTKKYNSIAVDSLITNKDTVFFVILENENPLYNRFAIYNSELTPLLIDKSLNGNISYKTLKTAGKNFIETDEIYLSKDTLLLNRISLYSVDSSGVVLSFRTHTIFTEPGSNFTQYLTEISDTLIQTKINGPEKSGLNGKTDNFIYNPSTGKYSSSQNLFDKFIKKEIENFNYQPVKKEITDTLKTN